MLAGSAFAPAPPTRPNAADTGISQADPDAERADASAKARAAADPEAAQELAAAEVQAAQIRQAANERMNAQVAELVAVVRGQLAELERQ